MNEEIKFEDFKLALIALWKKKYLIIAVTVLATLVGLLLTISTKPVNTYMAKASIYSAAYGSVQESNSSAAAMITYSDIVTSRKVCERAASLLSGEFMVDATDIQGMINASQESDTIMGIYAYSANPDIAVKVANAVAEAFVHEITSITKSDSIQLLDTATIPTLATNGSKDLLKKRLIFTALGLVVSCGFIVLAELFTTKIRTIDQCMDQKENKVLGIIPDVKI